MKTSKIVLLLTAAFILCFSSCQNDLVPVPDNDVFQFSDGDELLKKGKTSRTVPFKARYAVDGTSKISNGILTGELTGKGTATHLGSNTWFSNHSFDLSTGVHEGTMDFEKKGTGDKLFGSFDGIAVPNLPENPYLGSGNYVITSGTGKFKGVTGSGTYSFITYPDKPNDAEFTGTLTFPKKHRHRRGHGKNKH